VGDTVVDVDTAVVWQTQFLHTSSTIPTTFLQERTLFPTRWTVYNSAATARGAWTGPGTAYALNDFVTNGFKYAVCIAAHVSTASFNADVAAGKWSILIDLSSVGTQQLPPLVPVTDANKFVMTDSLGFNYNVFAPDTALNVMGATSIGKSLLTANSQVVGRAAIDAAQSTDTTTQTPGNNTTKYASTAFVKAEIVNVFPKPVFQLYDETILGSAAATMTVTIPASAKAIEIWFLTANVANVNDASGLILNEVVSGTPIVTNIHNEQVTYGLGSSAGGNLVNAGTGWTFAGAQQAYFGVIRVQMFSNGTYLNADYGVINASGTLTKFQLFGYSATSGTTGFRLQNGSGTQFAAGSYMRVLALQ
jgi:hypothetical protein